MTHDKPAAPFSVNLWGSHPDEANDDCWTGIDFPTLEAAKAWLDAPHFGPPFFPNGYDSHDTACLQLVRECDEDGVYVEEIEVRANPAYDSRRAARERADDDGEWRRESQMQSAMEFGVHGWNDYEGS